ncbi:MAG: 2-oxoacid:acceptor oxidoreductase subunit alpha [Halodesulfurarchaeum sp.]
MSQDELIWRIAGGSGDGIDSNSQAFTTVLMRRGLDVFTHRHYPSRIRGGHTYVEVRAAANEVNSRGDGYNFLLALGDSFARNPQEEAYYGTEELKPLTENLDDLREGGIIVYDEGLIDIEEVEDFEDRVEANNWHVYPIDLREMAREHGREVMRNVAGIGATAALIGMELDGLKGIIEENLGSKGEEIVQQNQEILELGYEAANEFDHDHELQVPEGSHDEEQVLVSGSHCIAYGAIDEGCRFIAGYPMTPWTDAYTIMTQLLGEVGGISEQVEDEIAAASMAVGASHTGVKAMSGSSGGGFALMSEPLGLAEMTETPLVLLEAQRAGPSTGMPTKPEQGDLEHVLYTSQGDSHRVVLAPGNQRECYELTRRAFQIAYEYQIPTVILYDQKLSGEYRNVPESFFDREANADPGSTLTEAEIEDAPHDPTGKFHRYRHDPENGVSPRSVPGQTGGRYLASGNEHNPSGHISEDPTNRTRQVERRLRKVDRIRTELSTDEETRNTRYGDEEADFGILTFGSHQGTVKEAVARLNEGGTPVKALSVGEIQPFPTEEVTAFVRSCDEVLVVEMNSTAQFRGHIQRNLGEGGRKLSSLLKYNGNPFEPAEIVEGVELELDGGEGEPAAQTHLEPAAGD